MKCRKSGKLLRAQQMLFACFSIFVFLRMSNFSDASRKMTKIDIWMFSCTYLLSLRNAFVSIVTCWSDEDSRYVLHLHIFTFPISFHSRYVMIRHEHRNIKMNNIILLFLQNVYKCGLEAFSVVVFLVPANFCQGCTKHSQQWARDSGIWWKVLDNICFFFSTKKEPMRANMNRMEKNVG